VQFKSLAALGAQEQRTALATAASKSFSEPGLTSICAISVIMGCGLSLRTTVSSPAADIIEALVNAQKEKSALRRLCQNKRRLAAPCIPN
jgi:hypothetical protein